MAEAGAAAWRVAAAEAVDPAADSAFHAWIASGCNAGMEWLSRYPDLRRDPRMLVPGARSVIVAAFPYRQPPEAPKPALTVSAYALGRDYHEALRERLQPVSDLCGPGSRICIDSAPLRERYWAVRAGLGYIGRNNLLIVPGLGSMNFLGSIVTPAYFEPDTPLPAGSHPCSGCSAPCVRACPTGAIRDDSTIDARRCLAYLTIEHRGPFPPATDLHGRVFGCDICALACPLNRIPLPPGQPIADFAPRPEITGLSADEINSLGTRAFGRRFKGTSLMRARPDSLRRNISFLKTNP